MTPEDLKKIELIAIKARVWAEDFARRNGFSYNLGCMCAIASAHLFTELQEAGIEATISYNTRHCFVRCGEYLVDITATQFAHNNHKDVEIVKYKNRTKHLYWTTQRKYTSIDKLRMTQQRVGWPENQWV
jgi:hypothetical protein